MRNPSSFVVIKKNHHQVWRMRNNIVLVISLLVAIALLGGGGSSSWNGGGDSKTLSSIIPQAFAFQQQHAAMPMSLVRVRRHHNLNQQGRQHPFSPPPPLVSSTATTTKATTTTTSLSSTMIPLLSPQLAGDVIRTGIGMMVATKVAKSGYKKQSLQKSGAIAAFAVATLSLACSLRSGLTLLWFYWTSSKLTRYGSKQKSTLEEEYKIGGKRNANQVLSCSLIAVVIALMRRFWIVGPDSPLVLLSAADSLSALQMMGNRLTLAFVGFFACCAGDTWASELGVLSKSPPRLITKPWKQVPPGTNGGVSGVGLVASGLGGLAMGLIHGIALPLKYTCLKTRIQEILVLSIAGFVCGLLGSLLDSILGATIQITYYDPINKMILKKKPKEGPITTIGFSLLSNEMVNVVSTALTAILAGTILTKPFLSIL